MEPKSDLGEGAFLLNGLHDKGKGRAAGGWREGGLVGGWGTGGGGGGGGILAEAGGGGI